MPPPDLPSILPPTEGVPDSEPLYQWIHVYSSFVAITTLEQIVAAEQNGKITDPDQTPIYICALQDCFRLYPNHDRLMAHRKRDHNLDSTADIITWEDDRTHS
ncbi:hypothetical protein AN958_09667 [Leucoagaricus sp. SymC.cos]|nr:hypothetical protein AN958_09667 [Leucoagaricus sp. SymC.cos]